MKTWTTVDKTEWAERGPWDDEPDKAQWIHEELDCLIVRGPAGALCGYVGVPESHPYFDKEYSDLPHEVGEVHGGLTFAARCAQTEDESRHICHTGEVANKLVWWFGFDCNHLYDFAPGYADSLEFMNEGAIYRNFKYVEGHVNSLAKQLRSRA